jgi:roadblock/LC7 domain-containing protein
MAKNLHLDIVKYHFDPAKDNVPVNAAIAKANSMMHDMERRPYAIYMGGY